MTEQKFLALTRMKCRARGVVSQSEHSLRLHTAANQHQRAVLEEVWCQTTCAEQQADSAERTAEAQERIAKNSTILLWVVFAFIVLDSITALLS